MLNEKVAFISLKKELKFNNIILKKDIDLPIFYNDLSLKASKKEPEFTIFEIAKAMLYIIELDKSFKYNNEYISVIRDLHREINITKELYQYKNNNLEDSYIVLKSYSSINKLDNDILLLELARELYEKSADKIYKKEALNLINKVDNYESKYHHANILLYEKEYKKAYDIFNDILVNYKISDIAFNKIKELIVDTENKLIFKKGKERLFSGDYSSAIQEFLKIRDSYPSWYELLLFLGISYRMLNEYTHALSYFFDALNLRNDDPNLYNEIGISLIFLKDYDAANRYLANAILLDENNYELLCNLAISEYYLGNTDGAKKYINKAYSLSDDEITNQWHKKINNS